MALSCIISEIKKRYWSKIEIFFISPLHLRPPLEAPCRNIAIPFGVEKLEWLGYPTVKRVF